MTPLLQELSHLEVESLQIVEHAPESEQESSLETFTAQKNVEIAAIWEGTIPVNGNCCCCCCCPYCCCAFC